MDHLTHLFKLKDLRNLILCMLNEQNIYMLYLTTKEFSSFTKPNHRVEIMTIEDAIKNKSISYINFALKNSTNNIPNSILQDVNIKKIIETNDLGFISHFINKNTLINFNIRNILNLLLTKCSLEVCIYFLGDNDEEGQGWNTLIVEKNNDLIKYNYIMEQIVCFDRIDIIEWMESVGINVLSDIMKGKTFIFNINMGFDILIFSLDLLKYLHRHKYMLLTKYVNIDKFVTDYEYAKWVLENIKLNKTSFGRKIVEKYSNIIKPEIAFLLYDRKYKIEKIIYEIAYCNDMVYRLREKDAVHFLNVNMVISDMKKNIFNDDDIRKYCYNNNNHKYTILYYLVKYDRFDLFHNNDFLNYENLFDLVILAKNVSLECFMNYIYYINIKGPIIDPAKLIDIENNFEAIKVYLKLIKFDSIYVLKIYQSGLVDLCYWVIDNINVLNYDNCFINISYIKYVAKTGDATLIKFFLGNKEHSYVSILKYVNLETLLKVGIFNDDILFKKYNGSMLRFGNNEIVNYIINNFEIRSNWLCSTWLNNSELARHVLKKTLDININLNIWKMTWNVDDNICTEYYDWIINEKFVSGPGTSNVILDNSSLVSKLVISDNLIFLKCIMKHKDLKFTDDMIICMMKTKKRNIFNYLVSINKIKFPHNIRDYC